MLHNSSSTVYCSSSGVDNGSFSSGSSVGGSTSAGARHLQVVVTLEAGWAWFIPLGKERTSVGLVSRGTGPIDRRTFEETIRGAGFPLAHAELVTPPEGRALTACRDWSFTHKKFVGPGFMMVGDAACFVDARERSLFGLCVSCVCGQ